jgi:hypothetical protein
METEDLDEMIQYLSRTDWKWDSGNDDPTDC